MNTNYYTFILKRTNDFWDLRLMDFVKNKETIVPAFNTSKSGNILYIQYYNRIVKTMKSHRFLDIDSNWYGETKLCLTERKVK